MGSGRVSCASAHRARFSLLPIGIAQTVASVETGLWYARRAEFLQQPWIQPLRWLRMPGDTLFLLGVGAFAWFMAGLWSGWTYETTGVAVGPAAPESAEASAV